MLTLLPPPEDGQVDVQPRALGDPPEGRLDKPVEVVSDVDRGLDGHEHLAYDQRQEDELAPQNGTGGADNNKKKTAATGRVKKKKTKTSSQPVGRTMPTVL